MKVTELFEAGGAWYKPRYDDERKYQVGSVIDWIKSMNISKEDIAEALEQFKKTEIFKKAAHGEHGMWYREIPTSEKNGTLTFDTKRKYPSGKTFVGSYKIYANGLIRYTSKTGWGHEAMTRLQSPKPRMKANDSVGSLVGIWERALEEVMRKWEKALHKDVQAGLSSKGVK